MSWDEESISLFQDFARDHPPCRDDGCALPPVATPCRGPSPRARDRGEPRDDPVLSAPLHSPSGVSSGRPNALSASENLRGGRSGGRGSGSGSASPLRGHGATVRQPATCQSTSAHIRTAFSSTCTPFYDVHWSIGNEPKPLRPRRRNPCLGEERFRHGTMIGQ